MGFDQDANGREITFARFAELKQADRAELGAMPPDGAQAAVEQILFNLIENACKYAEAAEDQVIRVRTQIQADEMLIHVADQGPGISHDVAKRLFHPFHKSSEEAARTAPGVGLGLALCRRLARDLGGDLQLDKSVSKGACFQLRLPLGKTTAGVARAGDA